MTKYFRIIQPDGSTDLMTATETVDYAKKILRNNHSVGQHLEIKDVSTSTKAYSFLSKVGFTERQGVNRLYNPSRIESYGFGEEINMPIDVAWEMRAKHAYPSNMEAKRPDEFMARLKTGILNGNFDPIPATKTELKQGILTEGKHRLIIAKKLRMSKVPIQIQGD